MVNGTGSGQTTSAATLARRKALGFASPTETATGGVARAPGGRKLTEAEFKAIEASKELTPTPTPRTQQQRDILSLQRFEAAAISAGRISPRARTPQRIIRPTIEAPTPTEQRVFGVVAPFEQPRGLEGLRSRTFRLQKTFGIGPIGTVAGFGVGFVRGAVIDPLLFGKRLVTQPVTTTKAVVSGLTPTGIRAAGERVGGRLRRGDISALGEITGAVVGPTLILKGVSRTPVGRIIREEAFILKAPKGTERLVTREVLKGGKAAERIREFKGVTPSLEELKKVTTLTPSQVKTVVRVAKEEEAIIFGSAAQRVLTRTGKIPKDIDIAVSDPARFKTRLGPRLARKLDVKPIIGRVGAEAERGLIRGQLPVVGARPVLGIEVKLPREQAVFVGGLEPLTIPTRRLIRVEGIRFTTFGEQLQRKGLGTLQALGGEVRRAKDPASFVQSLRLAETQLTGRRRARVERAIERLTTPRVQRVFDRPIVGVSARQPPTRLRPTKVDRDLVRASRRARLETPSITRQPSRLPSRIPSRIPSRLPSRIPSRLPSRLSRIPSRVPSRIPSVIPSRVPSLVPSRIPSIIPRGAPSLIPSRFPSRLPSFAPSRLPSGLARVTPPFLIGPRVELRRRRRKPEITTRLLRRGRPRISPSLIGITARRGRRPRTITRREAEQIQTGVGVRFRARGTPSGSVKEVIGTKL